MISPQYVDGLEQRIKELTAERDALVAHKVAVHKLTGLPASVGVCEPIEGFAERPQDLVPAVRDMTLRIKGLESERDALAAHVENLHEFIKTAPIGSGVCCCGDDIARHADPMSCGHSPVDEVVYSAGLLMGQTPKTSLARLIAEEQAKAFDELAGDLALNADNARENGYTAAADAMQDAADYALTKAEMRRKARGGV